jgi:hypothetical protein
VTVFDKNKDLVSIYPNPISEASMIEINSSTADMTEFSVLNINGALLSKQMIQVNQGVNRISLSDFKLYNLSNGVYFMMINNNEVISQKRFLIVK